MDSILKVVVDNKLLRELAKEEVSKFIEEIREGSWWDMKRLEAETCRKRDWLIDNILLNPIYKEEMEIISNSREGGRWMFKASEMRTFLNTNFHYLNRPNKTG